MLFFSWQFQDIFGDIVYNEDDDDLASTLDCLMSNFHSIEHENDQYLEQYFDNSDSDSNNPELSFLMA